MLETILEKILVAYFGEYLEGINSSNLHVGVMKGDIVVENVSLRRSVLEKLDLPFRIQYSNVKRM